MAKQDDGINGGYRGKVGPVVGYMWRGQWCTRTMPRFYHDAKTEAQLEQRELFKAEVSFAGRVKEVLHAGFYKPALAAHKTECNYFLMVNKGCFAWDGEGMAVDYSHLRVSEGPVAPVGFGEPVCRFLGKPVDTLLGQPVDTLLSQPQATDSSPNLGEQLNGLSSQKALLTGSSPRLGEVDARSADGGVCLAGPSMDNPHPDPFGATPPYREGMATQDNGFKAEVTSNVVGNIPSLQKRSASGTPGRALCGGWVPQRGGVGVMTRGGSLTEGLSITIPFEKNPEHRRCEADDRVYVAAFCDGEAMLSLPVYRRTRSITIELPAEWTGHEVHLYGFVQDSASRTSDSIYLGVILTQYTPDHEEIALDTPDLPEPSAGEPVFAGASQSVGVPEADSRQSAGVSSPPPDI